MADNLAIAKKVGIIGLGYVGLPLALLFVSKNFEVIGIDANQSKVDSLNNCTSYIPDIKDSDLKNAVKSGKLCVSTDYKKIEDADVIIICVPTPLNSNHTPDLQYLISVGNQLYSHLKQGQLVILESSTYPGTTKNVLLPILEKSNLVVGKEFYLGYSPERIDPGNESLPVSKIPKVVSGITELCKDRVSEIYSEIFENIVLVSSTEAAELTKLLENTYRFINISFINELAILCDKLSLNVWEIIRAADSKPYGFSPFYPGPGIGGHCIPVDPLYLQWVAKQYGQDSEFITISDQLNHKIIQYIAQSIKDLLPKENASVLIYGAAYKKNINDARESSIFPLIKYFESWGISVSYHDPFVPAIVAENKKYQSMPLTKELLSNSDCVLLLTDHSEIPLEKIMNYATLIYDTRNITEGKSGKAKIIRLGGGSK